MNTFGVSKEAREALKSLLRVTDVKTPVFTIAKGTLQGTDKIKYGVGIYEKKNLAKGAKLTTVEEFEFYLDPSVHSDVVGKTLHFEHGNFRLLTK